MKLFRALALVPISTLCLAAGLEAQAAACSARAIPRLAETARAQCFVELGRLQEAAWMYARAGDRARARELTAELEAEMRAEPVSVGRLSAEGVMNLMATYLVRFPSGVSGVFKPDYNDPGCPVCTPQHERAAFLLDTLMHVELTPLTIVRDLELPDGEVRSGSLMYFVDDAEQSAVHYSTDGLPVDTEDQKPDLLRLLDVFLGNTDRHQGNWLVRNTGEIVAIDHNRAFMYDDTTATTHWHQQYCRIQDLDALDDYVRRFESIPIDGYGAEFQTLLTPERMAVFRAAHEEIARTLRTRPAC